MTCQSSYAPHRASQSSALRPGQDAEVGDLLDRLRTDHRRGRIDDVRRIEARLARRGQAVTLYELAPAAGGGR